MVVVVDELWSRLVARNPIKRPATGSDAMVSNCCAKPAPLILNAALISSMLEKNRYSIARKDTTETSVASRLDSFLAIGGVESVTGRDPVRVITDERANIPNSNRSERLATR